MRTDIHSDWRTHETERTVTLDLRQRQRCIWAQSLTNLCKMNTFGIFVTLVALIGVSLSAPGGYTSNLGVYKDMMKDKDLDYMKAAIAAGKEWKEICIFNGYLSKASFRFLWERKLKFTSAENKTILCKKCLTWFF